MQTDSSTLALSVSPRTRGLFIKNLVEFQTELARVQAGFIPAMPLWSHRKQLPMLIFQTMRRIQELRLRVRELGLSLWAIAFEQCGGGTEVVGGSLPCQKPNRCAEGWNGCDPAITCDGIDDYLKDNNGVYDMPSVPLLEASRDELNVQINWAEEAVQTFEAGNG
jgi:hypothetical protein